MANYYVNLLPNTVRAGIYFSCPVCARRDISSAKIVVNSRIKMTKERRQQTKSHTYLKQQQQKTEYWRIYYCRISDHVYVRMTDLQYTHFTV